MLPSRKDTSCWRDMIRRTNGSGLGIKAASYGGCVVSEDFKLFHNFFEWMQTEPAHKSQSYHLDKDILGDGKLYSSETCCLIPPELNLALVGSTRLRANNTTGVIGVSWCKRDKVYVPKLHAKGRHYNLGAYKSKIQALEVYVAAKNKHIASIAQGYKDVLSPLVFERLTQGILDFDGLVSELESIADNW